MPFVSEQIYEHAIRVITPYASPAGAAWAVIPTGPLGHKAWSLASAEFRDWLAHSFHQENGIFPSYHALRHAIRMIQARARFEEKPREEIFTRIGWTGNPFFPDTLSIDLANPQREVVEITAKGWQTRVMHAWKFRAVSGALPLPHPSTLNAPDSSLASALGDLLHLETAAVNRIAAWLFTAIRPAGPYPILILTGPPASGKSTIARVLRLLIDPNVDALHSLPKDERELFVFALHYRALAFDQVPSLSPEMSVALARLASGISFPQRGHSAFDDPTPMTIERPIILTVPEAEASAERWSHNRTLAHLAMTVKLRALDPARMRSQHHILNETGLSTPAIFANLCNAVSTALANRRAAAPSVSRFTDAHQWTAAAAPALGLSREDVNGVFAQSPLITALRAILVEEPEWTGTPTALYNMLRAAAVPDLPANAQALSSQLSATPLAVFGIDFESYAKDGQRRIRLATTHSNFYASISAGSRVTN